jgi:hypothetical protein
VKPDYPNTSCAYYSANTLKIVVPQPREIESASRQLLVCAGDALAILQTDSDNPISAVELTAMSFKWYKKFTTENAYTLIAGQTAEDYAPGTISQSTNFKRETTITITGVDSPTCATGPFNSVYTINVNSVDPGEIIYGGVLKNGTTTEIDLCYGTAPGAFSTNGAKSWSVYATPSFEWYASIDGVNYSSLNVLTETYQSGVLTETTWVKRLTSSTYTYTINAAVATITCKDINDPAYFTNGFKINILPQIQTPTLTSTVNSQICSTDLSPGSIAISNMYTPTTDIVEYKWHQSSDLIVWSEIRDPSDNSKVFGGETYQLPQLLVNTSFRVEATVVNNPLCSYTSNIFTISVIKINPGVIAFTTPTAQDNYYQVCDAATPVITITNKSGLNHSIVPSSSTYTVTWQSKPKDGVSEFTDLTFGAQFSSTVSNTLLATNMNASIYIRKKVEVLNNAGDVICREFSNSVLIDYMPKPTVNIPDPSIFVTDPSCADGSDGAISITASAVTGGTSADVAQKVNLELSGTYSTTATFRVTIGGVNYDYTATASNTSINSITASITAMLKASAASSTLNISSLNNLITLTAKTAGAPFTITTAIINNTGSSFNIEYLETSAQANSYTWTKFLGDAGTVVDTGFANPGTLNLTGLASGRYQLAVTNNIACTTVTVTPTFDLTNPNPIVAGTLTSSLGDIVCSGSIPFFTVTGTATLTTPVYIWEQSPNGINWTTIKNGVATVTTATYSVTNTLTQTTWFRRGVNSNIGGGNTCAAVYSYTPGLKITINAATPGTIQYAGNSDSGVIEVCYNTTPLEFSNGSTPYTVSGAQSFEWYQSIDSGNNWALITGANTQNYTPAALTQTTLFKRKVLSSILSGVVTVTCDDSNEAANFSNIFTLVVKQDLVQPSLVSTVNTVCASDLSRGVLSINNATAVDAVAGIIKEWQRSTDQSVWTPISDGNGGFVSGNNYTLPALYAKAYFRVKVSFVATGANSPTCEIFSSNVFAINVIDISPGKIDFLTNPVTENVLNTCTSIANPIVIGADSAANEASVPDYQSTYTAFWESKGTNISDNWDLISLSGNYAGSDRDRVLTISNSIASSVYVRRGIKQEISTGVFCTDYSNPVLINVLDAAVVTIADLAALITVPACPGEATGSITIPSSAITGGSQVAQAQKVNIILSGTYTQTGTYTPTGRYEVTVGSTTYSYTATVSNTSLESLTASLTAIIASGPTVNVASSGRIITLTASDTATPFVVSTNISNRGTDTKMTVEYADPALGLNSYKWEKLNNNNSVDTSVTLSSTLSIENLAAGLYRLTVTNNASCASTVAPIFTIVDKVLVAGTLTASTGSVLCTDHIGFTLTATGTSSNTGQTYIWDQSTNGINGWTNVLSGTTSVTAAAITIGSLTDTTFYRRGLRIENAGVACGVNYTYTPAFEMVVNKVNAGAISTEELLVCAGSIPAYPIVESGAASNLNRGVITYFWESRIDNPGAIWSAVTGATNSNLTFTTPLNATTAFRRVAVNTINSVSCNSTPSGVVTITTVTPTTIDNATINTTRILNVSCNGLSDGSINVALTDFTTDHPNPTFSWTKEGDATFGLNTMAATGLGAGSYQLTIATYTNTIGGSIVPVCTKTSALFIISEPNPLTLTLSATCEGNIVATGAGGLQNYIYTLTSLNQAPLSVAVVSGGAHTFANLVKGSTYTVTLTENGLRTCSPISKPVTLPTDLVIDKSKFIITDATCFGINDGKIQTPDDTFISGGSQPFTYQWTGPASGGFFTRNLNNLAPGQYTLVVTDALACTATYIATIGSVAELEITNQTITNEVLSCNGASDAAIDIEVASGGEIVSYAWTNNVNGTAVTGAGNSPSVSGLSAGVYKVTVKTVIGCEITKIFTIREPDEFAAALVSSESPNCFDSNGGSGAATFTISGGTPPYKYSINNGGQVSFGTASNTQITKTITGLGAGSNNIVFTDSNTCSVGSSIFTVPITIPEEIEIAFNKESDIIPIPCGGIGSISISASGGTGPYLYQWTGPNLNRVGSSLVKIEVTAGGSYTVAVTDANKCTKSLQITMPDPEAPFTVTGTVDQAQCAIDAADASIALTISTDITPTITWQKWTLKSAAGGTASTTTSTCTTSCYEWAGIEGSNGKLLLSNLSPGEYRVSVVDTSAEAGNCNTVVKNFSISASSLEIYNTRIISPSCEVETGSYVFKLKNTHPLKFFLNGTEIFVGTQSGTLKYSNTLQQYSLPELLGGSYLLRIIEQIPSGATTTEGCEVFSNFILGSFETITYQGLTEVILDICSPSGQTFPNPTLVSGGVPFVSAAQESYYIYRWTGVATTNISTGTASGTGTGTSSGTTSGTASNTTGGLGSVSILSTEPVALLPGNYKLVIEDSKGCLSDPISFLIAPNVLPLEVTVSTQELNCGLNNTDGAFSASIRGGAAPYAISWELEIPGTAEDPTPTYELLATNVLNLNNLGEGRYRLTVVSGLIGCDNTTAKKFTKIYTLFKADTITILDGPFLSKELCQGAPGTIDIKVFDSQSTNFNFRYAGSLVTAEFIGDGVYRVIIDSPQEAAVLDVVNDRGCAVQTPIITGVGIPDFSYTSTSLEQTGLISANEVVTFTNTSEDLYTKMRWDFGDGTPPLEITAENEATTDIEHRYKTPGTFQVTLRFYNALGCYKETEQEIRVGKGYLVIFPSAFTPNNDGINDIFECKFTGIKSFTFEVYDMWGNQLYVNTIDTLPTAQGWGWNGNYPSGKPYAFKTFRYSFIAISHDDKEIITSGEATLLR